MLITAALAVLTLSPLSYKADAPAVRELYVQRAAVDLTPPEPLPLGGYTARGGKLFEPGGEPLFARTTLLSGSKTKLAVVSLEMLTVPESLVREVRKRVGPGVEVFLCATHTHSAPDSQMLNDRMTFAIPGIASFKKRWLEWYSDRVAASVKDAMISEAKPVLELTVNTVELTLNRGRREGAKPDPHAYTVSMVTRAKVEDKPQPIRLTSPLWITYAAHAVLRSDNDNVLSGDWPGALAAQLNTSVLPGAIGDASPVASGDSGAKKVENFFHSFSQTWVSAFAAQKPAWKPGQAFSFVRQPVKLGDAKANPEFARANKIPEPLAETLVKRFAPAEAEITAFRVGKLAVVGVPGEPTSHLGAAISAAGKKLGFSPVLVVSHVNGWAGYMLDAKDYAKGGYEATLSFYGPEGGPKVVTAATEALRRLR